jgi:hypothetical protein
LLSEGAVLEESFNFLESGVLLLEGLLLWGYSVVLNFTG